VLERGVEAKEKLYRRVAKSADTKLSKVLTSETSAAEFVLVRTRCLMSDEG